jgi:hypothetical protein
VKIAGINLLQLLELRVNREKEIIMSKFFQNSVSLPSVLFGSLVLIALMSTAPVAPAHAQGVPAGLSRLDPPQASNDVVAQDQRSKVRAAYARSRKIQSQQ